MTEGGERDEETDRGIILHVLVDLRHCQKVHHNHRKDLLCPYGLQRTLLAFPQALFTVEHLRIPSNSGYIIAKKGMLRTTGRY